MTALNGTNGSPVPREPVRFLVFAASLRSASLNARLARLAASTIERHDGTVDLASMEDFDCPSYDGDGQDADGFPPGAEAFRRRDRGQRRLRHRVARVQRLDARRAQERDRLGVALPPAALQRTAWLSLLSRRRRWSAATGAVGAARPARAPRRAVFPDMFSLRRRTRRFDAAGTITNPQLSDRFEQNIVAFMDLVEAAKHYPCAKKAWVEFLGEHPDRGDRARRVAVEATVTHPWRPTGAHRSRQAHAQPACVVGVRNLPAYLGAGRRKR